MFLNGTEIHKFKANDSKIVPNNLCIGNISKNFQQVTWKETDFSIDYDAIDVDDILDIHKYLVRKNDIVKDVSIY